MRIATVSQFVRLSLFASCSVLALGACSKSDSDSSSTLFVDFGAGEGFSTRTATNLPMGSQDPTDWQLDRLWNSREQSLFQPLGLTLNAPVPDQGRASSIFIAGYPNPSVDQVAFTYSMPAAVACKLVIVNSLYQVIKQVDSPALSASRTLQFDVSASPFQKGQRYRVYYVMYKGTTLYYKGHGDVKVASPY